MPKVWSDLGGSATLLDTLTLALDGDGPVAEFSEIARHFTALAKAPSDEIASPAKIDWIIDGLQASIALATVKGVSTEPDVVEKAVSAYAAAGRALEGAEPIPYSPKITCDASGIAAVLHDKLTSIRFEADLGDVTIVGRPLRRIL